MLRAFPRAAFSENETAAACWLAKKLDAQKIPSVREVKNHQKDVLGLAGSAPETVKSDLGNYYCKTSLASILTHVRRVLCLVCSRLILYTLNIREVANPNVRKHLRFYPEDSYPRLAEARQAERWLHEVDPLYAGVMARQESSGQDFHVYEPALANVDALGTLAPVIPVRFFLRNDRMVVKAHLLCVTDDKSAYVIDGSACMDIPLENFLLSFPRLMESHGRYGLPSPMNITGMSISYHVM